MNREQYRIDEKRNILQRDGEVKGLKCLYTNLDTFNGKRSELEARIALTKPDIIGLTETNPKKCKVDIEPAGLATSWIQFVCNLDGRGVALYIKESIRSSEMKLQITSEASIWCEVQLRGQDVLIIGVLYRSPNSTDQESNQIIMMITEAVSRVTY